MQERSKNILVVDDEKIIHNVVQRTFLRTHHNVVSAFDGRQARKMFISKDPRIDLVLLDIHLPGVKGTVLLEKFKKKRPTVPVIIITGFPTLENTLDALNRGASDFVVKPFTPEQLQQSVSKAFRLSFLKRDVINEAMDVKHTLEIQLSSVRDIHWSVSHYLFTFIRGLGFSNESTRRALFEAIANAVIHGNKFDPAKKVRIKAVISAQRLEITVSDEGDGYDYQNYIDCSDVLKKEKGLFFIHSFMDKIIFNDLGNTITMVREGVRS